MRDFESRASASSATPASEGKNKSEKNSLYFTLRLIHALIQNEKRRSLRNLCSSGGCGGRSLSQRNGARFHAGRDARYGGAGEPGAHQVRADEFGVWLSEPGRDRESCAGACSQGGLGIRSADGAGDPRRDGHVQRTGQASRSG